MKKLNVSVNGYCNVNKETLRKRMFALFARRPCKKEAKCRDTSKFKLSMAKSRTTFKPGQSGNPEGRRKGVPNKISREIKNIIQDSGPDYLSLLFERASKELANRKEKNFHATRIVAAFVLRTIPSLKHIAVQADIRQEIRQRIETLSESDLVQQAEVILGKYQPPEDE